MTEQNNSQAAPPAVSPVTSASVDQAASTALADVSAPPDEAALKAAAQAKKAAAAQTVLDEKAAMAWAHTARFFTTASEIHHLQVTELPEIAFVGRSNAGKSTAINTLTDHKRLAFASKTPGRTQHINLFEIGPKLGADAYFADLPGYGYAAVARGAKQRWQKVMADYLEVRRSLTGVVLMLDSRLGFTDLDKQLLAFVAPRLANGSVKLLVLLTKSDKLNRRDADAALRQAEQVLAGIATDESDIAISLFSALKKKGVSEAALTLHGWVHPASK
jgi:GTP-binding protein